MLLTAAHVVGSLSWAHNLGRSDVYVFSASGAPRGGDPLIGHVVRSHPPAPTGEIELDVALIEPISNVVLRGVVRDEELSGVPRDVEETADEDNPVIVHKRGINTPQLTHGLLIPVAVSLKVDSPRADGGMDQREYVRGYFVYGTDGPFARPGDSGSIVVDDDDCVVGLLVALRAKDVHNPTEDDPAFVVPIMDILDRLDLHLPGPDRPCTTVTGHY